MSKRVVVWALLLSLTSNQFGTLAFSEDNKAPKAKVVTQSSISRTASTIATAPFRAIDWTLNKAVNGVITGVTSTAGAINRNCATFLNNHVPAPIVKSLSVAGHVIPIVPLMRTLENRDTFFFTFIESPAIGLITTPASSAAANMLDGKAPFLDSSSAFYDQTAEIYQSYQGTQLVRNGIAVNKMLSPRMKLFLNWYYSTLIYGVRTAGPKFANAQGPEDVVHAATLLAFAPLWPLFSQRVGNWWALHLFSRYPSSSLLKKIKDISVRSEELIAEQEREVAKKKQKVEDLKSILKEDSDPRQVRALKKDLRKAQTELGAAESVLNWVKFFRTKKGPEGKTQYDDDGGNSFNKRFKYWATKTKWSMLVAVLMTTTYFIIRWALVGRDADDDGWLKSLMRIFLSENGEEATEDELNEAVGMVKSLAEEIQRNPAIIDELDALAG